MVPSYKFPFSVSLLVIIFSAWSVARRMDPPTNPCPNVKPNSSNPYTRDIIPGIDRSCCLCPAGTYLEQACNSTDYKSTKCTPCKFNANDPREQYYNENEPHKDSSCKKAVLCSKNMDRIQGNSTYPARCICKKGMYYNTTLDDCVSHTSCLAGFCMAHVGNSTHDTSCVPCPSGYKSSNTSSDNCKTVDCSNNGTSSVPAQSATVTPESPGLPTSVIVIMAVTVTIVVAIGIYCFWCTCSRRERKDGISCFSSQSCTSSPEPSVPYTSAQTSTDESFVVNTPPAAIPAEDWIYQEKMRRIRAGLELRVSTRDMNQLFRSFRPDDEQFLDDLNQITSTSERFNKVFAELLKLGTTTFNPELIRQHFMERGTMSFVAIIDRATGSNSAT